MPVGMSLVLLGFSCCIYKMGKTLLPSKHSLPDAHRSQYYGTGLRKENALVTRKSNGKETGGKVELCLPDGGVGARFKGFQH